MNEVYSRQPSRLELKMNFQRDHVLRAIMLVQQNGVEWLQENYPKPQGRPQPSRTRFLHYDGGSYPLKPLCRLAGELADQPILSNPHPDEFERRLVELEFEFPARIGNADSPSERRSRLAKTLSRPQQAKFRKDVFDLHRAECIISGCS